MQAVPATPDDTLAIYSLLHDVQFQHLPEYSVAKPILESTPSIIIKEGGRVVMWAQYFGHPVLQIDLAISPIKQKRLLTKGVCKYILAYGFNLTQSDYIAVECYSSEGVKAALGFGFTMPEENSEREGWVRLTLNREEFKRKFRMRG